MWSDRGGGVIQLGGDVGGGGVTRMENDCFELVSVSMELWLAGVLL